MLKTIKTTKKMRFDELLKYIWDDLESGTVRTFEGASPSGVELTVIPTLTGHLALQGNVVKDVTFRVEVEEEITNDTIFDEVVRAREFDRGVAVSVFNGVSIGELLDYDESLGYNTVQIQAFLDGKLETVWERDLY